MDEGGSIAAYGEMLTSTQKADSAHMTDLYGRMWLPVFIFNFERDAFNAEQMQMLMHSKNPLSQAMRASTSFNFLCALHYQLMTYSL